MNVLVLLGHPDENSFCSAVAHTVVAALSDGHHSVIFHDLNHEDFPTSLPAGEIPKGAELPPLIARHCAELASADGIVVVHPNWWGQPPAVLKGWVDRVVRPGVAYEFLDGDAGEGVPNGLLKARAALVFNTSNTPYERELQVFADPLETIWKNCIFGLCGVHNVHRHTFRVIATSTPEQRKSWLLEAAALTRRIFPPDRSS